MPVRELAAAVAAAAAVLALGCGAGSQGAEGAAGRPVEQTLAEHTAEWMSVPGVVGTAVGELNGRPCILVLVAVDPAELAGRLPEEMDGHPVIVKFTGELRALGSQ